ncbi:hypothetical protein RLOatenuis_2130 [Rickettsiales bacterium]|nr:hypothetical protein RLOatenuis_2130 [Rickettsiales bacterium]
MGRRFEGADAQTKCEQIYMQAKAAGVDFYDVLPPSFGAYIDGSKFILHLKEKTPLVDCDSSAKSGQEKAFKEFIG